MDNTQLEYAAKEIQSWNRGSVIGQDDIELLKSIAIYLESQVGK